MGTFFDDASLVMIPSGVKEDKLYSIKPTDGSGDFTFSRGSDIQATRVNSSGLIEKAKENLLLQSNTFSTTWTLDSGMTLTSGQSGYDGSSDAWLLERNVAFDYLRQDSTNSGVQTYSVYAKAGTLDWIFLRFQDAGGYNGKYFDLSNGVKGSTEGTIIDSNITSLSGGWYRCDVTINATLQRVWIYPVPNDNGVGDAGAGNIYIQDAQLNYGLIAQDYVETTSAAVVEGLTADLPRLDYSGGASCPSLLLEPSRTNALEFSDYLSGSFWFDNDITRTQNTTEVLSPEGVYNAVKLTETATTARHRLASNNITTSTSNYTASVFMKMGTARYGFLNVGGQSTIVVDLQEGAITDSITSGTIVHSDIENYGNGWYRLSVAHSLTAVTAPYLIQFGTAGSAEPTYNNRIPQFLGSTSNNIYVYGAQLEAGSYPTSYIPTYSAAANRGGDVVNEITGVSDLIGQTEGTLFVHTDSFLSGVTSGNRKAYFYLSDGTFSNRIELSKRGGTTTGLADDIAIRISSGGVTQFDQTIAQDFSGEVKIAFAYKNGDVAAYINGSSVYTNIGSVSIPATSQITIGNAYNEPLREPMKQALLFKTRLTNAELAALTTI